MRSTIAERPAAPFALSLVGLIVQFTAALVIGAVGIGMFQAFGTTGGMMGGMMGTYYSGSGMMGSYSPWLMSGMGRLHVDVDSHAGRYTGGRSRRSFHDEPL